MKGRVIEEIVPRAPFHVINHGEKILEYQLARGSRDCLNDLFSRTFFLEYIQYVIMLPVRLNRKFIEVKLSW